MHHANRAHASAIPRKLMESYQEKAHLVQMHLKSLKTEVVFFFPAIFTISSIGISISGIPHTICSVLISSFNNRVCLSKDKPIFPSS